MKPVLLLFTLLTISFAVRAQSFAIIDDKDGYVNVRKAPNGKSPVIGKLLKDDIFNCLDNGQFGWINIYNQATGVEGFVHKDRIFPLSKFRKWSKNSKDGISVSVTAKPFKMKGHKLDYNKDCKNCGAVLETIDGKYVWGADGEIPKKVIASLTIIQNNLPILIPKSAFNDLYEPNISTLQVFIGKDNTLYIQLNNSDGAGCYSVMWVVKNNKYFKRYLDNYFA
jgi:hypothetical protein